MYKINTFFNFGKIEKISESFSKILGSFSKKMPGHKTPSYGNFWKFFLKNAIKHTLWGDMKLQKIWGVPTSTIRLLFSGLPPPNQVGGANKFAGAEGAGEKLALFSSGKWSLLGMSYERKCYFGVSAEILSFNQISDGGMSPINSETLGQAPQQKILISVPGLGS